MLETFYSNLWVQIALAALAVTIGAWIGDWRRERRRHIDAVGFMPWTAMMVLSMMVALVAAALAIARG